jgi:hypothetical protein
VHHITSEASGEGKNPMDSIKDAGLSDASIKATPLVLGISSRGDDVK